MNSSLSNNLDLDEIQKKLMEELSQLRSREGFLYAGLPKFRRIFGRDSIISARQMLPLDPSIARSTILKLSSLQGSKFDLETGEEEGKIPHESIESITPDLAEHMKRVPWLQRHSTNYFTVDATPMFISLVYQYFRETGDRDFVHGIIKTINSAIKWTTKTAISNGTLVYFKAGTGSGLQSQSWRDGIGSILELAKDPVSTIGVQGYLQEAIDAIRELSILQDVKCDTADLDALKERNISAIIDYFFLDDIDYFALAIDGDGVAVNKVTSDPGHLLYSGVLPREMNDLIVSRLMEPDMFTDYGIRTLSAKDQNFDDRAYQRGSIWPHDNWMIAEGMNRLGYHKEYEAVRESMYSAYEKMGQLPEYYGVDRSGEIIPMRKLRVAPCYPQAWSTGAMLNFIESKRRKERNQ